MSDTATVDSGVPQGSGLGPVLFLIDINDPPDYITNGSGVKLFADDSVLYREIKSKQDVINLQHWEKDWLKAFYPQKCHVFHITKQEKAFNYQYSIHGYALETVQSAKHLGVHLHH